MSLSSADARGIVGRVFICLAVALVGLALVGWLLAALYAGWTYRRRAKRSLVQDEVYNLVLGIRNNPSSSDDVFMKTDAIKPLVNSALLLSALSCLLSALSCLQNNLSARPIHSPGSDPVHPGF